jgi:acyl-CoA synthetase (AMP-forming)/AMP-acid ligase II
VSESFLRGGAHPPQAAPGEGVMLLSCGSPIKGVEAEIRASDGATKSSDYVIGEICISGSSLYSGYYRRPEITRERLVNGWHRTGDLGFFADGELYVTGRVDDLLIVRGKNVYAHEIEEAIKGLNFVAPGRVVAFSAPNASLESDDVIVVCELRDAARTTAARREIREAVEAETGVTLAHIQFAPSGALLKTTSGKISRDANRAAFLESRNESVAS